MLVYKIMDLTVLIERLSPWIDEWRTVWLEIDYNNRIRAKQLRYIALYFYE